jgi:hypothetical protein
MRGVPTPERECGGLKPRDLSFVKLIILDEWGSAGKVQEEIMMSGYSGWIVSACTLPFVKYRWKLLTRS